MKAWPFDIPRSMQATARKAQAMFPSMRSLLPPGTSGDVEIRRFTCDEKRALVNRCVRNEYCVAGEGTQLSIAGTGWMFDTTHEKWLNRHVLQNAKGRVLLGGLGLGMILWPLLRKGSIESIDVLEMSEDVIRLVLPSLKSHPGFNKLRIIHADAREWIPYKSYDYIWLDCVPAYGWSRELLTYQSAWIDMYGPYLTPGGWCQHWGYSEHLEYYLHRMAGLENGDIFIEGMPIGPPDPLMSALVDRAPDAVMRVKGLRGIEDLELCNPGRLRSSREVPA